MKGGNVRRKSEKIRRDPGFLLSLGPEHLYPGTSWGWAFEVPETLSHALGARISCGS